MVALVCVFCFVIAALFTTPTVAISRLFTSAVVSTTTSAGFNGQVVCAATTTTAVPTAPLIKASTNAVSSCSLGSCSATVTKTTAQASLTSGSFYFVWCVDVATNAIDTADTSSSRNVTLANLGTTTKALSFANSYVGEVQNAVFTLRPIQGVTLLSGQKIRATMPAGWVLSSGSTTTCTVTYATNSISVSGTAISGQMVTVTLSAALEAGPYDTVMTCINVKSPVALTSAGTLTVVTLTDADGVMETQASVTTPAITEITLTSVVAKANNRTATTVTVRVTPVRLVSVTCAAMTSPNVPSASTIRSNSAKVTVAFCVTGGCDATISTLSSFTVYYVFCTTDIGTLTVPNAEYGVAMNTTGRCLLVAYVCM
jgi:hypothetical protein